MSCEASRWHGRGAGAGAQLVRAPPPPPPCATPRVGQGCARASPAARRPTQAGPPNLGPAGARRLLTGAGPGAGDGFSAAGGHTGARQAACSAGPGSGARAHSALCAPSVGRRWLEAGGEVGLPCPASAPHHWVARVPELGSSCGPVTTPQPKALGAVPVHGMALPGAWRGGPGWSRELAPGWPSPTEGAEGVWKGEKAGGLGPAATLDSPGLSGVCQAQTWPGLGGVGGY